MRCVRVSFWCLRCQPGAKTAGSEAGSSSTIEPPAPTLDISHAAGQTGQVKASACQAGNRVFLRAEKRAQEGVQEQGIGQGLGNGSDFAIASNRTQELTAAQRQRIQANREEALKRRRLFDGGYAAATQQGYAAATPPTPSPHQNAVLASARSQLHLGLLVPSLAIPLRWSHAVRQWQKFAYLLI